MSEIINITPAEQRLQAQVQALTEQLELERGTVHALSDQLESVRADAARFAWIRWASIEAGDYEALELCLIQGFDGVAEECTDEQFNACFDSAMKAGGAA